MIQISVCDASINFGWGNVFDNITFDLKEGERIGLVGKNGCGKSTLLRTIIGEETLSSGHCAIKNNCKIGYFKQFENEYMNTKVREVMEYEFLEILSLREKLNDIENQLCSPACDFDSVLPLYDKYQNEYENKGGYSLEVKIEKAINQVGFSKEYLDREFSSLSGGEKSLIIFARIMMNNPDVLLLDEPTNHLDLNTVEWLESFLKGYRGAVLVVSHDRYFLDKVVDKIIEFNNNRSSDIYFGNYTAFVVKREEKIKRNQEEYDNQQREIASMKQSIATLKDWGNRGGNLGLHRRAESIQRKLDKLDKLNKPILDKQILVDFKDTGRSGKDVLILKDVSKTFDTTKVLKKVNMHIQYGQKIGILGANGAGKSTLLKIILGILDCDYGGVIQLGCNIQIGYIPQDLNCFDKEKSILDNFMDIYQGSTASARKVLAQFQFLQDEVNKLVRSLSGGEMVRLRLCQLMQQDINFLIMDEPTNHLDIYSRETIENAINNFLGSAIIVSHDRYFLDKTVERIFVLENGDCKEFFGNYSDYLTLQR